MTNDATNEVRAIFTGGHWEIEPSLIGTDVPLPRQQMNNAERERIIQQRTRYLEFMHDHFADAVMAPPAGTPSVNPEGGHHG